MVSLSLHEKTVIGIFKKCYSTSKSIHATHRCKVLVVGGGSGGCSVAAKLSRVLKKNELIILEPRKDHYYQPLFTLIGGGVGTISDAHRYMQQVLPNNAKWIRASAVEFCPKENTVTTSRSEIIHYDVLVVAVGLDTNYHKIPGLVEALSQPRSGVCSNYDVKYVNKTFKAMQDFKKGNAIFTYPNSPVKCAGAAQKACYIAEDYFRRTGKRTDATVMYNTSLGVIFGVKKYADVLWKVCKKRNIVVNLHTNLVEVIPDTKEAVFQSMEIEDIHVVQYSMLHVTPPMCPPKCLKTAPDMVNKAGFVKVNSSTLQSTIYPNIFAIGDCCSTPNSKTSAAAAAQCPVVFKNVKAVLEGKKPTASYDGYTACPLVTGYNKCILAEFNYNLTPLETFPFKQDKELYSMYLLKKVGLPTLYWQLMLNGRWNGPETMRNLFHLHIP